LRPVIITDGLQEAWAVVLANFGIIVPAEKPEAIGTAIVRLHDEPPYAARLG